MVQWPSKAELPWEGTVSSRGPWGGRAGGACRELEALGWVASIVHRILALRIPCLEKHKHTLLCTPFPAAVLQSPSGAGHEGWTWDMGHGTHEAECSGPAQSGLKPGMATWYLCDILFQVSCYLDYGHSLFESVCTNIASSFHISFTSWIINEASCTNTYSISFLWLPLPSV